ncbi:MAG: NAD(P)H-dependent oxidoreductase subunit E [Anaerolineales bacterium]|nr:NAD(P)H-dependent oxidoreductase subunit E [Anaerolineales bacterium]
MNAKPTSLQIETPPASLETLGQEKLSSFEQFFAWQAQLAAERHPNQRGVRVCDGAGCRALGSQKVLAELQRQLHQARLDTPVEVVGTGCPGFCECGPLVTIDPEKISYQKVQPKDIVEIVQSTLLHGQVIERLLYHDPQTGALIHHEPDLPFYSKQKRMLLDLNGRIDPTRLQDYIAQGGYRSFVNALVARKPDEIIAEVKASGLRGRGGAGFPAGMKWELCRKNVLMAGDGFIICNADEGDPGAFMDRSVMEGNPHSVLEGMLIGAYAIGVKVGYVYIRAEYPLAVQNLRLAIRQAEQAGLLGEAILGSGFSFQLHVRLGAGAFVCGEETALMASVEGRVGEPRPRPPYPAESGLWGLPTNINNVETWANVPIILRDGSQAYAATGTEKSKGTKIFSLVGKINNTGLVEVPMGISLREVIFEIGGGISKNKPFKAVQLGGPSGGCVPAEFLDVKIDYESLTALGAIMGSGGMVVADADTCMVDFARYFMSFTQQESCGKCLPCRIGTKAMLATLERICAGQGEPGDLDYLLEVAETVHAASLCGLGQTAPNPVLSTLRYFRPEYEAHIFDKQCPAGVCKGLITYSIIPELCTGCMVCLRNCPSVAIHGEKRKLHWIDPAVCNRCGMCRSVCKFEAVAVN